jgi:hypothetical protein
MQIIELFRRLNDAGVPYVVVGGIAVILHGYKRLTDDIDLVVSLRPEDAARCVEVARGLGLRPRAPVDPALFANAAAARELDPRQEYGGLYLL